MSEKSQGVHYAWWVMIGCFFLQAGALGAIMNAGGIFIVPVCNELGFDRGALALYLTFYFMPRRPRIRWLRNTFRNGIFACS